MKFFTFSFIKGGLKNIVRNSFSMFAHIHEFLISVF